MLSFSHKWVSLKTAQLCILDLSITDTHTALCDYRSSYGPLHVQFVTEGCCSTSAQRSLQTEKQVLYRVHTLDTDRAQLS